MLVPYDYKELSPKVEMCLINQFMYGDDTQRLCVKAEI